VPSPNHSCVHADVQVVANAIAFQISCCFSYSEYSQVVCVTFSSQ
jgi:hypothetical protein